MSDINVTVQDEIVNIDVIDTPVLVNVVNSPGQQGPAGPGVPVGGTAGQVLAKNSSTNYDTVWVNQSGGVPYSGATGNVNLGEYELKAGQVTLDTSPTGTAAVGTIRWNDTTGTSETTLKGGNVIIKNGVDLVARVVNKVTPNTTLTKAAYQAVRVSGAQGQRLAIELAQANNDAGSADTIGLVTETIAPNQEGFIMTVGQLEGINTTGSLQGETWADGDVLYLSPNTAGRITNVKPTGATGHLVIIGYVEYAHANNGKIYVKVMNGWELDELHNVSIVSPANNQGLFYNSSNSLWENKTIDTALGFTPANAATTLTINGVTFDLSANRSWTIAAGISGSGAAGQVTYWTGASAVSGSNNLFWDNANSRLGIGTNAPISRIETFNNSIYVAGAFSMYSNTSSDEALFYFRRGRGTLASPLIVQTGDVLGSLRFAAQFNSTVGGYNTNSKIDSVAEANGADLRFYTNNAGYSLSPTEKLRIFGNGNVAVNSTSDLGVRFGVVGDTLLRGSGNTSATTALTVQNSSSTNLLTIDNSGFIEANTSTSSIFVRNGIVFGATSAAARIGPSVSNAINVRFTQGSTNLLGAYGAGIQNSAYLFSYPASNNTDANTNSLWGIVHTFNPTSASSGYIMMGLQPTINQTGGANGITRGLYVNPTLTSAADWRSIEWSNNTGWGLYGAGTAANYLGGVLSVGTLTTVAGYSIVTGSGILAGTHLRISSSIRDNRDNDIIGQSLSSVISNRILTIGNGTYLNINFPNGNVLIGGTTDSGNKLQVYGDTLLRGSGATSATTALTVQNSSSTNLFSVRNDGNVGIGTASPVNNLHINTSGAVSVIRLTTAGTGSTLSDGFAFGYDDTYGGLIINRENTPFALWTNNTSRLEIKANGQVRFMPLASAPASPQAGDVYYDSTLNKLRVYTTAWETITSV